MRRLISQDEAPKIQLLPLIDIFMVLLVIFMVTVPVVQRAIKVRLPSSVTNEKSGKITEIVVYLDVHGKTYLNATPVERSILMSLLKKHKDAGLSAVALHADTVVPYGTVVSLVDAIKSEAGITHVVLATQKQDIRP